MLASESIVDNQEDILKILSDEACRKIISSIQDTSKSAHQISLEQNIELSKVYRRLQRLQKYGMLKTTFRINNDGKKSYYYQSKLEGINVSYHQDSIRVNLTFNE